MPTNELNGKQRNSNWTVFASGQTRYGHAPLIAKPHTMPAYITAIGCFKARSVLLIVSIEQVIKFVKVRRINLSFAISMTALLSVKMPSICVEKRVSIDESAIITTVRYETAVFMIFGILSQTHF